MKQSSVLAVHYYCELNFDCVGMFDSNCSILRFCILKMFFKTILDVIYCICISVLALERVPRNCTLFEYILFIKFFDLFTTLRIPPEIIHFFNFFFKFHFVVNFGKKNKK